MLEKVDTPPKAIVIVDDEKSFTDLLGNLLEEHFTCPILMFRSPAALLKKLPELNIGILVTDYYMPHMNGLELIRIVSELTPSGPPCILITGHLFEPGEHEESKLSCFKEVLPKPFRWQLLASMIVRHWPAGHPSPLRHGVNSF